MLRLQTESSTSPKISLLYLLLLMFLIQTKLTGCQAALMGSQSQMQGETTDSPGTCIPECSAGYECVLGQCTRQQCSRDCNGEEQQLVCGSNGVTYNSPCELEKARCEQMTNIKQEHEGTCVTLHPPPVQDCKMHQHDFDQQNESNSWYTQKCDVEKLYNGTIEHADLYYCYRPQCDRHNDQYIKKQCSSPEWCWCATSDGHPIHGSFQSNMPNGYCTAGNRRECEFDGHTYDDGNSFTPSSVCGLCECVNGTIDCYVNITVDASDELSSDQLENLKKELISAFTYQSNHDNHDAFDIRLLQRHPFEVANSQKETVLRWKFAHYDRNKDNFLNSAEEFLFHRELYDFYGCASFFDHLEVLMDSNNDNKISQQEWSTFFDISSDASSTLEVGPITQQPDQPVKRQALISPLHLTSRKPRKKFRYLLVQ